MRPFQANLAFVRACLAELDEYERAEALFWTLSASPPAGSPPFLQMTAGNLVLALDEMRAVDDRLSPRNRAALTQAQIEWETRWMSRSVRLETKVVRELDSRIAQWKAYVNDALESGDLSEYSISLRPRLSAARLLEGLGGGYVKASAALAELQAIDARLEPHLIEGPCALGTEMAAVYPPSPLYRFLYRRSCQAMDVH